MSLYIKETGNPEEPVVVFLHGGGVSGWMWNKQVEYLKDCYVLTPDLPGHGKSIDTGFTSMKAAAEEIISSIEEKAGGRKVNLIGFSLGAQLAVEILSIRPQLVEKAVIASALVRPIRYGKGLIDATIKLSFGFMKKRSFQKLQAKVLYIDEEYFDLYFNDVLQVSKENMTAYLNANMSYKLPDAFSEHKVKSLILVGGSEKRMMLKSAQDLVKANSFCQGYVIPKAGHGASLADPQLFNRIIESWLKEEQLPSELQPLGKL